MLRRRFYNEVMNWTVTEPGPAEAGRFAGSIDPQGGSFTVMQASSEH